MSRDEERQAQPNKCAWHVLDVRPNAIAEAVVHGEIAALAGCRGSDVKGDRWRLIPGCISERAQAESEIAVLRVAEIAFVKAPHLSQRGSPIERRGGAWGEYFLCRRTHPIG